MQSDSRYAVLCYGMPLKILRDLNLKEQRKKQCAPSSVERRQPWIGTGVAALGLSRPALGRPAGKPRLHDYEYSLAPSHQRRADGDAAGRSHPLIARRLVEQSHRS